MHPNSIFDWTDREAMLAFVRKTAFATIYVQRTDGAAVVHTPVMVQDDSHVRFHLSRRNRAHVSSDSRALISCLGCHAYISPDWYGTPDQVPTWNYVAVECEGPIRRLDEGELARLLDYLSAVQESALAPKAAWTRDKMREGRFEAMTRAIEGFEVKIEQLRGSRKLGQNKSAEEVAGACEALRALGQTEMADLMSRPGSR